jgi:hypothetical protein
MMKTKHLVLVAICALAFGVLGACKKKAEGGTEPAKAAEPAGGGGAAAAGEEAVPDKAAVDALDCQAACAKQADCAKASGAPGMEDPAQLKMMVDGCKQGCDMMKQQYDPAMHGTTAALMIKLAGGACY